MKIVIVLNKLEVKKRKTSFIKRIHQVFKIKKPLVIQTCITNVHIKTNK